MWQLDNGTWRSETNFTDIFFNVILYVTCRFHPVYVPLKYAKIQEFIKKKTNKNYLKNTGTRFEK